MKTMTTYTCLFDVYMSCGFICAVRYKVCCYQSMLARWPSSVNMVK